MSLSRIVCVGLGGMVGSCARYALSSWLGRLLGPAFPYGTLAVNLVGSLLIGMVMWTALHTDLIGPNARLALTTGLLGGFTTYSAFNYETLRLFQERAWLLGAANVGATLIGCLAAGWLGWAAAAWILGNRQPS